MPQRILGIDVGAWSAKSVLLEDRFRGFAILRAHEVPIAPGDPGSLRERQIEALRALITSEPERVDTYVASYPGERASVRWVKMPYADAKKVNQTIDGELADLLPFDVDDGVYDHAIVERPPDGSSVSLAAAAREDDVEDALAPYAEAEADPKFFGVDMLQLYNLYTHYVRDDASKPEGPVQPAPEAGTFIGPGPDAPPDARLILDIGHRRTLVCVAHDGGIAFVRAIRAGGADVTRAIARGGQLEVEEAELIKHEEGFVASSRHPAPDERAQQISDLVAQGLVPLVRELRRTLLAIRSEKRVRVARIDLVGGGSRLRNLAHHLAEQLNVPVAPGLVVEQAVEREIDPARRPAFALALAVGLRVAGDQAVNTLDLRTGRFQFVGQLQHLRGRIPAVLASAAVLALLLLGNVWASYRSSAAREAEIDQQFCSITKQVLGQEICEPKRALSALQNPTSEFGNIRLPDRSALEMAAELSERIPKELDVRIREMSVSPDRAKITGEAATYEAVDQIVAEYSKDPCYTEIKKGKLQKLPSGNRIEFQLSMNLGCS